MVHHGQRVWNSVILAWLDCPGQAYLTTVVVIVVVGKRSVRRALAPALASTSFVLYGITDRYTGYMGSSTLIITWYLS